MDTNFIERACSAIQLSNIAKHASKSFLVHKLRNTSLLWLNESWFLRLGYDLSDAGTRKEINRWLCDEFGYAVRTETTGEPCFHDDYKMADADRYGEVGYSPHGGSGRVGQIGVFQVKGIGRTPLLGDGFDELDRDHFDGCLKLEEAIKEAIFSSVMEGEFPKGVIPVIAIIDTGIDILGASGQQHRRALLLRAPFIRPAHLLRAPYFRPIGSSLRDAQVADGLRTREFSIWFGSSANTPLLDLSGNIGEQMAFGHVHRISHGGFCSSNLSISGELVDFGASQATPTWIKSDPFTSEFAKSGDAATWISVLFEVHRSSGRYGLEHDLKGSVDSFLFRYNFTKSGEETSVIGLEHHEPSHRTASTKIWDQVRLYWQDGVHAFYEQVYRHLTGLAVSLGKEARWILGVYLEICRSDEELLSRIINAYIGLAPRPLLFRTNIESSIAEFVADLDFCKGDGNRKLVQDYISHVSISSRRVFQGANHRFAIATYSCAGCECILAIRPGNVVVELKLIIVNNLVVIGGQRVSVETALSWPGKIHAGYWIGSASEFQFDGTFIVLTLGRDRYRIGAFVWHDAVNSPSFFCQRAHTDHHWLPVPPAQGAERA